MLFWVGFPNEFFDLICEYLPTDGPSSNNNHDCLCITLWLILGMVLLISNAKVVTFFPHDMIEFWDNRQFRSSVPGKPPPLFLNLNHPWAIITLSSLRCDISQNMLYIILFHCDTLRYLKKTCDICDCDLSWLVSKGHFSSSYRVTLRGHAHIT